MGRHYVSGTARDTITGQVRAGSTISVFLSGTTTPASIYAASTGGVAITSVLTDINGAFGFYVDEADYAITQRFKIIASKIGYTSITYDILPFFSLDCIDTDTALTANSDKKIATQKAIKAYADGKIAATITNGDTTHAPNGDVVYDALSGKNAYLGIESIGALSFNNTSHILTIATGVTYWIAGVQKVNTGSTTCDIDDYETIADRTLYWFYFDDISGTLKCDTSINLLTQAPVATVYWNGTAGAIQREYHNYDRPIRQHIEDHNTIGCRYKNDGGFSQTYPSTSVDASLQIEIGTLYDEDLSYTTGQLTTMRCWHQYNATSYTFSDYALPYPGLSGDPYFLDVADYTLKSADDSKYVCYWVYGSLDNDRPLYIFTKPIAAPYNTVALARAESVPNLVILGINAEIKLLYRWIYKGDGQYQEAIDYRTSSPVPSGGSQSISASSVTSLAHGTVSSTNVQGAIEELADEKAPIADPTFTGTVETPAIKITTGAGANKILTSDADGDASWQTASAGSDGIVGEVKMWPMSTVPSGYLECNGASLSRATYASLFAILGEWYGHADDTHFNLPDYRGRFPRFWDHAKTLDPDRAARSANGVTGASMTSGDYVGTVQADGFKAHTHTLPDDFYNGSTYQYTQSGGNMFGIVAATGSTGGNETRPANVYLMPIIKY